MARFSEENYRDKTPRQNRFTKMFKSRKSSSPATEANKQSPESVKSSPPGPPQLAPLKEGFEKVGLFPSDRILPDHTIKKKRSSSGLASLAKEMVEQNYTNARHTRHTSEPIRTKVPHSRRNAMTLDEAAAIEEEYGASRSSLLQKHENIEDARASTSVNGSPVAGTATTRRSSVSSNVTVADIETNIREADSMGVRQKADMDTDEDDERHRKHRMLRLGRPPVVHQPARLSEVREGVINEINELATVSDSTDSSLSNPASRILTPLGEPEIRPDDNRRVDKIYEIMLRRIQTHPEKMQLGPFSVKNPQIIGNIHQFAFISHLVLILAAAISGPKALITAIWTMCVKAFVYDLAMCAVGWRDSTSPDAVLEPFYSVMFALGEIFGLFVNLPALVYVLNHSSDT